MCVESALNLNMTIWWRDRSPQTPLRGWRGGGAHWVSVACVAPGDLKCKPAQQISCFNTLRFFALPMHRETKSHAFCLVQRQREALARSPLICSHNTIISHALNLRFQSWIAQFYCFIHIFIPDFLYIFFSGIYLNSQLKGPNFQLQYFLGHVYSRRTLKFILNSS